MNSIVAQTRLLWASLTEPHASIEDEEIQVNSRILAILLVTMLPITAFFLSYLSFRYGSIDPFFMTDVKIFSLLLMVLIGGYFLNHHGYYHTAAVFVLAAAETFLVVESILDHDPNDLAFLVLPISFAVVLLPKKILFFVSLCYLSAPILILPYLQPSEQDRIIKFIIPILAIGVILNIIARTHRDTMENLREKKLQESELRYSLTAGAVNDGIWDWDLTKNKVYYSPRWKEMIGYESDEISDSPDEWQSRIHPDDLDHVVPRLSQYHNSQHPHIVEVEYRFKHKNGGYIWVLSRGRFILDENGVLIRSIGSHTDITEKMDTHRRLSFDALHDALTGLANRALFNEKLNQAIKFAQKKRHISMQCSSLTSITSKISMTVWDIKQATKS